MTKDPNSFDCILAGGGLANALIALRLAQRRPEIRIAIVDAGASIGGNHTWSFHDGDVNPDVRASIDPLVAYSWPAQEVRFGARQRVLHRGYESITSQRVHDAVTDCPMVTPLLTTRIGDLGPEHVDLVGGRRLTAPLVIDGRGALASQPMVMGYQKFVGLELETQQPHGLAWPILMDARVPQHDGYRFVYSLPFAPNRLLVEDTYYSDNPSLDTLTIDGGIRSYAAAQGWNVTRELRREQGVLAIPLAGDIDAHWRALGRDIPRSGLRAWLFHATTGYSLPQAAALAEEIAQSRDLVSPAVARLVERRSRLTWEEQAFCRMLNRLLFIAARPTQRINVMKRFYQLPEPLIARFYAGKPTRYDKMRILSGWPPVSIIRAIESLPEAAGWNRAGGMSANVELR